ncbi:hypothetical protein ACFW04_012049 [Cataglyphis niger]
MTALLGVSPKEGLASYIKSMRPNCRKCDALEKISLHVLCVCPAYDRIRRELLGSAFPKPQQIGDFSVKALFLWRRIGLN